MDLYKSYYFIYNKTNRNFAPTNKYITQQYITIISIPITKSNEYAYDSFITAKKN